jgi:hypothetical protein
LDVLVRALAFDYWEHRQRCEACRPESCAELAAWRAHLDACRACQGDAPLDFGPPCPDWRERRLEHGEARPGCNACPHLRRAIAEVVDWRDARRLLSRAEALRAELEHVA